MSDLKGVGGSSAAHFYGSNSSQDRTTTVKVGENTLADVARRLGNGITEEALRKENPHIGKSVLPGQDVRLPPPDEIKSSKPKTEQTNTEPKNEEPRNTKTQPKKNESDWKVKPTIVPSTDDTYDRGGTSSNRKQEQERLDRTRPRDERDLDPKVIEADRKKKLEEHKKAVDRGRIDPEKAEIEREMMKELGRKLPAKP